MSPPVNHAGNTCTHRLRKAGGFYDVPVTHEDRISAIAVREGVIIWQVVTPAAHGAMMHSTFV